MKQMEGRLPNRSKSCSRQSSCSLQGHANRTPGSWRSQPGAWWFPDKAMVKCWRCWDTKSSAYFPACTCRRWTKVTLSSKWCCCLINFTDIFSASIFEGHLMTGDLMNLLPHVISPHSPLDPSFRLFFSPLVLSLRISMNPENLLV